MCIVHVHVHVHCACLQEGDIGEASNPHLVELQVELHESFRRHEGGAHLGDGMERQWASWAVGWGEGELL